MEPFQFEIMPFDVNQASEQDWTDLNAYLNRMAEETLPGDPPVAAAETARTWMNLPPVIERSAWVVRQTGVHGIIGLGWFVFMDMPENRHLGQADAGVLPEHRRKGIGKRLLQRIAECASTNNRRLLIGETTDLVPAGQAFMQWAGAEEGMVTHLNQLILKDVDTHLIAAWQAKASERASGFELVLWEGPYPEEELQSIAVLKEAMNQAPTGTMEIEDFHWTPELLRQVDQNMVQSGVERWCYAVRETATGNLAGFTDLMWRPAKPDIAQQGDTAVLERYRGLGLGRWLKAAMLEKVLREHPNASFVRTVNAFSNEPMLKINNQLGFKHYRSTSVWQLEVDRVLARDIPG